MLCYGLVLGVPALAQTVSEPKDVPAEWSKPYPPFQIVGNLYYVGTYDLACYLITSPNGNILINTGLANSAKMIKENVEALGFKFADIKILLTTQAHYDHMGAMVAIKKATGAKIMIDAADAQVMADGGSSDYALGKGISTYQPIKADRLLKDGAEIKLGNTKLTMLHHPGHTKGSCSFIFDIKDKKRSYRVLIANMPSIVTEEKFDQIKAYPSIAKDYAYTLAAMKKLTFDIWLSSHASQFALHKKHQPGSHYDPTAFIDRSGYDAALLELEKQYLKKVADK
jgi:metallo-beta-lactamase class B